MLGPESLPLDFLKGDEVGSPSRVLFVGGCHINGFPVGEEYAFTRVALGCLSEPRESTLYALPLLNLRSGPQVMAACRELRPDAVVLQLGHYEAPASLQKSMGRKHSKEPFIEALGRDGLPRVEKRYSLCPATMIAELERIVAAGLIIALGRKRRMFDPEAIAVSLDSILVSLKELPMRGIVLVGPFSAPDPVTRFFRRKALPIFEAAAKRHGCAFVNVFSLLESCQKWKDFNANFADPLHLSVSGHLKVGALVGAALKRVMEQSAATEAEPAMAAPTREVARTIGSRWAGRPVVALHT